MQKVSPYSLDKAIIFFLMLYQIVTVLFHIEARAALKPCR